MSMACAPALRALLIRCGLTLLANAACLTQQAPVTATCDPYLCGDFNGRYSPGLANWGFSCSQHCTSCDWSPACPFFAAFANRYTFSWEWTGQITEARVPIPWNPCDQYDVYCSYKRSLEAARMWA